MKDFNRSYFAEINTPDKAYWLGFLAADGYIMYNAKNKGVELTLKDRDAVEKLARCVDYPDPIRETRSGHFRLALYSKEMAQDLMRHGSHPGKTFTLEPWQGPDHLVRHYWRGMFDGDGGISKYHRQDRDRTEWAAHLVNTHAVVKAFRDFIAATDHPYNVGSIREEGSVWRVLYGGIRPAQAVARTLYQKGDLCMDRKRALSEELLALDARGRVERIPVGQLTQLREELGSWTKVAEHLEVSRNGLYKRVRKLGLPRRAYTTKLVSS